MEHKIPFNSYDFWAYLSAGFLFLFALDQVAATELLMRENWTIVQGVIAVSCAYTVGQIVESMSSWLFEKLLVGKVLGYPSAVLFGKTKASRWVHKLLPGYFEQLPGATQKAVRDKGKQVGVPFPGEALFWPAFANARTTPAIMNRLDIFLNLSGFCRNVALVAFIDAVLLYWSYLRTNGPHEHRLWACIALAVCIGMIPRYLKYFRLYGVEVFTSYAYSMEIELD
jgi:hypothetical protein